MATELKPCPFCGGEVKMPYQAWDDCKRYAEEAWNRRAKDE